MAPVNFDKKRARKKYPVVQGSVGNASQLEQLTAQQSIENRRSSQPDPESEKRLHIDLRNNQPIRQEKAGKVLYAGGPGVFDGSAVKNHRFAELHHHIPPIKQYQNSRAGDEFFSAALRKSQKATKTNEKERNSTALDEEMGSVDQTFMDKPVYASNQATTQGRMSIPLGQSVPPQLDTNANLVQRFIELKRFLFQMNNIKLFC